MKFPLLTSITFLLLAASPAGARDKQSFPIQWKVGSAYVQNMTMAQQMTLPGGQGEMQTKMSMELSATPKKGAKEGTTEVTMTYDKADMSMKMGDSDLPGGSEALKALVGKSVTAVYDAEGMVVDVKDLENLISGNPALARTMNKDSMKQMMSQASLMARPEKPVSPGDSWNFDITYPMPLMKMAMKGKYTYEKDEDVEGVSCARLVLDGTLTMEAEDTDTPKKEGEDPQAAQQREALKSMGFKVTQSAISGVMHYDFALGHMAKTDMDMSLTMSMKDPSTQQAIEMPMKTKVSNTLKIKAAK